MNQADVSKVVSKLRFPVHNHTRKFRDVDGPKGRLEKLKKTVTALFKYERIELNYPRADEARGYAERLLSDAIRHGDCHNSTMRMADFWLTEKQLIHKLFKVLVPRFQDYTVSYTRMHHAPTIYQWTFRGAASRRRSVLELKGNPYPPLIPDLSKNRNLIHNVLLEEARKEQRQEQYLETARSLNPETHGDVSPDNVAASWVPQHPPSKAAEQAASSTTSAEPETKHPSKDTP